MKLSALNTAIRNADNVKIWLRVPGTTTPLLYVVVQKTSLLEALKAAYGGDRHAETQLSIRDGDGLLICEDPEFAPPDPAMDEQWNRQYEAVSESLGETPLQASETLDLDDLL